MSRSLKFILGAIALLVVLAVAVPSLIPAETYKGQIIAAVERSTGRTLTIDGDLSLQFRPGVEFSIEDVTLSNAAGASDPLMAEMARMTIGVDWSALFSRKIKITKFILEEPVIFLEVMKNGTANWEFAAGEQSVEEASDETGAALPSESLDALSFGDLRIVGGHLVWRNRAAGQTWDVSNVNLDIVLPDLKGMVKIKGDLTYNNEDLSLALELGSLEAITSGAQTSFKIALKSRLMNTELNGTLTGGTTSKIEALANVEVPSVRALALWTGAPVPVETGFGLLAIKGKISVSGPRYAFSDAQISFDDMNGTGALTIINSGKKPVITGQLTMDKIDLRPYMKADEAAPDNGAPTEVQALAWDKTPIDFSGLKAMEVDFKLKSQNLFFQDYEIGDTELNLAVRNGALSATLDRMDLYGGSGSGAVSLGTSAGTAQAAAAFTLTGINAAPLMLAATDKDVIEGKGEFSFDVRTNGKSQDDLMRNLAGKGALTLRDGKLKGVNLARMLQILGAITSRGQAANQEAETKTGTETGTGKSTDFVEMGGTFTIDKGVLKTTDFALINEAVSLGGEGRVDIGKQTINMKLTPGGKRDDGGTKLKMKVKGPWNDITYTPDFEDVIKSGLRDLILGKDKGEPVTPAEAVADQLLDAIFGPKK
jgi:AsmA protein